MSKQIRGATYLSVPEAADRAGVSRMTMLRWVSQGIKFKGTRLKVLRDPISNHYYIAEESVTELADRYHTV